MTGAGTPEASPMNASQMLSSETSSDGRSAPGRSGAWGVLAAVVWVAGPAIAAYAVYADDWRPLVALLPLLLVDHVVLDKWIASDPGLIQREAEELFTEEDEEVLSDLRDEAGALDNLSFVLENPELVNRWRYRFRGGLVVRSAATVTEAAGWLLLVAALPGQPPLGALGALLALAASGSPAYQLTRALTPHFRVRATADERRRWLRRDKLVEYALWTAVAVLVGYKLIAGDW